MDAASSSDEDAGAQDNRNNGAAGDSGQDGGKRPVDAGAGGPTRTMVMSSAMTPSEQKRDAGVARDASAPSKEPNMAGSSAPAPADAGAPRDAGSGTRPPEPVPHCREGIYAGTFSGMIQVFGLSLSTVTGTLSTQLRLNPAGTYLELRDARVIGVDQDGNTLTVDLSGNINCMSNELEDGTLTNGVFHNVASNGDTPFVGEAQGTYSSDPHSVVGTFTVQATDFISLLTGRGTWNLILSN
jgi:hypothetical protein